nr:centrosomal protein of 126 kDa isoform X1 [Solea senegalensis]
MTYESNLTKVRMQVLQDNFFYHSNSRFGAGGGLAHERQLLLEEQKLCKARARKLSLETNRRRKALEEKRRQLDMQDERLKESILQQRRQQIQDATERFQNAHLPPSQRRRRTFRRNVPTIEAALGQIQGTLSSNSQHSPLMSNNSNINRSCTPSLKPPTVSKSTHSPAVSAVEAYNRLLQEQFVAHVKNCQKVGETQQMQHDHSPQDSYLSDSCDSESPLSRDSLEIEDPNHSRNLQGSYSSFWPDSEKPHKNSGNQKDLFLSSDMTRSAARLLDVTVTPSENLKQETQEQSGALNNKTHFSKTETHSGLNNCNLLTLCEIIHPENFENSTQDNITVTDRANTALDSSCPKQDKLLDLTQKRVHDDRHLKHQPATDMHFVAKNGNSKEMQCGASPKPNILLNDSKIYNISQKSILQQTGKENHCLSSRSEPSAFINNLNYFINSELKHEKSINTPMLQHACSSSIPGDTPKCLKCPEEDKEKLPFSVGTSHSGREVRLLKGILKKKSRYVPGDATCASQLGHLIFAKQVALAIRDSVELTKVKAQDVESNNNIIKKRLRWFDGVHVEEEDEGRMKAAMSSHLPHSRKNLEDHQQCLSTVSWASKPGPNMTPPVSFGYQFTKKAWADVGVQVSLPQERANEVKVQCSTRPGGPKVPQRERSTRAASGPVSTQTRKGTVIRPQSATEVNQIAKTQGKVMVPRPPPRTESTEEKKTYIIPPCDMDQASANCKQAAAVKQALFKDTLEGFSSTCTRNLTRTNSTVMYTPMPPAYTHPISEDNTKGKTNSGHPETQGSGRRGIVFDEKRLCLDSTPTDEEIAELWHSIRGVFATKEVKTPVRGQPVESGRFERKVGMEQNGECPGSANTKLSQPIKQMVEPVMKFSRTFNGAFTDDGERGATQLHLAEGRTADPRKERVISAAMETAQTQCPGTGQHGELTSLSLEEQKILLSLDRLNHRLYCMQGQVPSHISRQGLVLIDAPPTKEIKVTNHNKQRLFSVNNHSLHSKKF